MIPKVSEEDRHRTIETAAIARANVPTQGRISDAGRIPDSGRISDAGRIGSDAHPGPKFAGSLDHGIEKRFRTEDSADGDGTPRTFFVVAADAGGVNKVSVTAGVIRSFDLPITLLTVADNDFVWIDATVDSDGNPTAVDLDNGAAFPDDTSTHVYKKLAKVVFSSGNTVITPLSWNWVDVGLCAGVAIWDTMGSSA